MKMPEITRRNFFKIAARGFLALSELLAFGGLIRFLSYKPSPPPPAKFEIGSASDYPLNSQTVLQNIPAILFHTQNGYSALSLVCSHLGCTVGVKSEILDCPCHGSRYDVEGNAIRGPAGKPLQYLRVELTAEGNLIVYKS